MKKLIAILSAVLLLCGMSTVALADITAPEGYTVTPLFDFTALADGESTATDLGFWTADANAGGAKVVVNAGKLTFSMPGNWGAFPGLSEDQKALTKNATGWGFYVEGGEIGGSIGAGFNAANEANANNVLKADAPIMLVALDGTVTIDVTYASPSFYQGVIYIPAGFAGYVYIPFSSYVANDGTGADFNAADGVSTPIYAMDSDIASITYGEFFVYQSDIVLEAPTPEPTPEPTEEPVATEPADDATEVPSAPANDGENAGFPVWIIIAAAAVVVIVVVVIVVAKKKKA